MSRIGKAPISIPSGVNVTIKDDTVTVKGPKGELTQTIHPEMEIKVEDGTLTVTRPNEEKETRAQHGLYRSLINNMVIGVSEGYKKQLELVGVGYRATNQGQLLELALGFSHPIQLLLPAEIKVEAVTDRKSNPIITLESADKQLLGQVCAKIRSMRKPEPYKGKGVRFKGEEIRRKAGKSAKV
ncbi:50S ribosomal protein L6 [Carboxylicivirga sp. N1Y90]|uniref:50S ribosomal protein L6 n=1 Tax=Carboxylicivirga fragile TaxID=3417571 RepID=UPI003D358AC2|nr:50S ribosomal protein L6 [Marinilabiliaceae bacterium N1Y90]